MAERKELKNLLMKVKEDSENVVLKFNIQKTKIMASGPITSWQIDGDTMETVSDFILRGSKITANGDCSHEIKRLTPWKEIMSNLDSRDIALPTMVHLVKAMVFPEVLWTIKKAAAAAKSLQSCLTLCDSIDGSPLGPAVSGILQAKTVEWVAISFSNA